jgi:site-specific DNA-methyltransferase (adenine-specific)
MLSNEKMYKCKWVWNKNNSAGFANAKIMPFQICEDILVFGSGKVNYYPIMEERGKPRPKGGYSTSTNYFIVPSKNQDKNNLYYPKHLLNFSNASQKNKLHPTQKPVALCEYLIKTYTNEGETVLDNCAGSFTTAVACDNTNRNWICMEKEEKYCNIGLTRINDNRERLSLPLIAKERIYATERVTESN